MRQPLAKVTQAYHDAHALAESQGLERTPRRPLVVRVNEEWAFGINYNAGNIQAARAKGLTEVFVAPRSVCIWRAGKYVNQIAAGWIHDESGTESVIEEFAKALGYALESAKARKGAKLERLARNV